MGSIVADTEGAHPVGQGASVSGELVKLRICDDL